MARNTPSILPQEVKEWISIDMRARHETEFMHAKSSRA